MLAEKALKEVAVQKELLVAQSEVHRSIIALEIQNLRASLTWLDPLGKTAQTLGSWGWAPAAAAGLLLAWRGRSILRWAARGLDIWRVVSRFWKT
jgi:hypothetical protein